MQGMSSPSSFKLPLKRLQNPAEDGVFADEDLITAENIATSASNLQNAAKTNYELRLKHADEPERFLDSEEKLFVAVKSFLSVSTSKECVLKLAEQARFFATIPGLLEHENIDIASSAIEVLHDILGSDGAEETQAAATFASTLLDERYRFLDTLLSTLDRLPEAELFTAMELAESMLELVTVDMRTWISWLVAKYFERGTSECKYYAAEITAMLLLQPENVDAFIEADGIESTVTVLAAYTNANPEGDAETEYMENLFDILCTIHSAEGKRRFVEAEGFAITLKSIHSLKLARLNAIKLLSFILLDSPEAVQAFVDCSGSLGVLFAVFVQKDATKLHRAFPRFYNERDDESYIIGIMYALALLMKNRARLQAKFIDEPDKMPRLAELETKYELDDFLRRQLQVVRLAIEGGSENVEDLQLLAEDMDEGPAKERLLELLSQ